MSLIASQHTVHQVTQGSPEILPTCQPVLVDEQDVVFEAGVQVRLESEVHHNRVVVTVDVRIHTIQALEDLA